MRFKAPATVISLRGKISVPADKSIAHRAIMFSSLACGKSIVKASVFGRDNFATARVMSQLGVKISGTLSADQLAIASEEGLKNFSSSQSRIGEVIIESNGMQSFHEPAESLFCGNSGTSARLLTGVLAGCSFTAELTGDESLSRRPFRRVVEPLSKMGAKFSGEKLPLRITGGSLKGIAYNSPHASAQVKSAVLLAGLQADGQTTVSEPIRSRDHTERLLSAMGVALTERQRDDGRWEVSLVSGKQYAALKPVNVEVPADFSSASFFLVLASIVQDSAITLLNIGVNPTRLGLYSILKRMGARMQLTNERTVGGEPVADLEVQSASLRATEVTPADVVLAIDEIPVLCVAAACAEGVTKIYGAQELRVKESDRLSMIARMLAEFGIGVKEFPDGLEITGNPKLALSRNSVKTRSWDGSGDHRIEMCGALLEFLVTGEFEIRDSKAVETSFPTFLQCFQLLAK